jgi:pantoate--beta-alanine ligase
MTDPRIVTSVTGLRDALGGIAPGLVPTMGALHEGHAELIARSASETPLTVVSVFVNPSQFNDPADFEKYPRTLETDAAKAGAAGASLIFAPASHEIYPAGFATTVIVSGLTERWEGAVRPGHFAGVATVVSVLLNAVRPARSYFGEKDYQQLQMIRRMHADLRLPGEIVGCPTVRSCDGLALSSRNARLSPQARGDAAVVPAALSAMQQAAGSGVRDVARLEAIGRDRIAACPAAEIDYLAVVDPATLEPVAQLDMPARVITAVLLDGVRLLDNMELRPGQA